jgi:hypothetical protein
MMHDHPGQGRQCFEFLASGLMEVQTERGREMRKVAHFDFENMQRTPELFDDELHCPTICGAHHIVRLV